MCSWCNQQASRIDKPVTYDGVRIGDLILVEYTGDGEIIAYGANSGKRYKFSSEIRRRYVDIYDVDNLLAKEQAGIKIFEVVQ